MKNIAKLIGAFLIGLTCLVSSGVVSPFAMIKPKSTKSVRKPNKKQPYFAKFM